MRRIWITVLACAVVVLNLVVASAAQAQAIAAFSLPTLQLADATDEIQGWLTQLESEVLPKLESILFPEQRERFKAAIAEGASLRKAFKSITLNPEQKSQIKDLLKELPSTDVFASLTPEQKKQLFTRKGEAFMPSSGEISEKINSGMKTKGAYLPEGVSEKINAKIKDKESFIPTPEDITKKISDGMKMVQEKIEDVMDD